MSPFMNDEELAVLDKAYRMACAELGLGANSEDTHRREHLAELIVGIAREGNLDPAAIAMRAFELMKTNELA